jgi:hypothetical protein
MLEFQFSESLSRPKIKNISLYPNSDLRYAHPVPCSSGGAMRIVTFRWARDAMAAGWRQVIRSPGRNAFWRTAKSCGPGAATLASIPAALWWLG